MSRQEEIESRLVDIFRLGRDDVADHSGLLREVEKLFMELREIEYLHMNDLYLKLLDSLKVPSNSEKSGVFE